MKRPANLLSSAAALGVAGLVLAAAEAGSAPQAVAATAKPPTLRILVPARVHPKQHYTITVEGTFDRRAIKTTPYLVAYLQFTGASCKRTVKAEHALPGRARSLDFAGSEQRSPFGFIRHWTADAGAGSRRVCAYLFPHAVSPNFSATKPLLTASKAFRNT